MQAIIYKNAGRVCVTYPTADALQIMTIQQLAEKDVPTGLPFKIVDVSDIPSDRSQRAQWDVSDVELTDGVGS